MDKYSFRFSDEIYNELGLAFSYWMLIHSTTSVEEFIEQISSAFALPCLYPEMKQVYKTLEDGRVYRRVNVWRYGFLYRIDEAERELVIDILFHERSNL